MPTMFCSRARLIILAVGSPLLAQLPAQGIKNFYEVDQHVYRGAQPDKQGFEFLAKLGVKTVVNLREDGPGSRREEKLVTEAGMKYIHVPMTGLTPPTDTEIKQILALLEDQTGGAVFVHCKRGADRTGTVIAAYRVDHDGWNNNQALKEAMARGMSPLQHPRQNYIRSFQRATAAVSTSASLPEASTSASIAQ
jgi:tyrosine-protein phosphatase SIW14